MSRIESLPQEVLVDEIFPQLSLKDALALFSVNKFFAQLGRDEVFWKRRLFEDFNYSSATTARSSGFKFLYSRLHKPRTFVWGESSEGRLGRQMIHIGHTSMQFWPLELSIPGGRVVELTAGGWSFSALNSEGEVYVWGQLEQGYGLIRDGFSAQTKQASKPLKLGLPAGTRIQSLSCGRNFATALDQKGRVWCFNSWGRPFIYQPKAFDPTMPGNNIVQVESGWSFASALTASGTVYVWAPLNGDVGAAFEAKDREFDGEHDINNQGKEENGVIQCHVFTLEGVEPLILPPLPKLPKLRESSDPLPKIIKVGGGDQFIVALTDVGHVLKLDIGGINNPDAIQELDRAFKLRGRQWEYLPLFCETEKVRDLGEFNGANGAKPPTDLHITHISAHFHTFAAYSTGSDSIVLMGLNDFHAEKIPNVIRSLQNRGVISIVLGDYHYGALLENGKLLTWGAATCTGLGNPFDMEPGQPGGFSDETDKERGYLQRLPEVREPTEVRFDHNLKVPRERFVFSAAAAGWHMGALIVDLEEGEPEQKEPEQLPADEEEVVLVPSPIATIPIARGPNHPFIFRGGMFPPRIGLPGAGRTHEGRNLPPPDSS